LNLSALSAFIFDLDGVIWRGSTPIEGAAASVARLRAAGKRCFYCTNNSRKAPADFVAALRRMEIEVEEDEVMTSSTATALYLAQEFPQSFSAYVVGEEGLVAALRGAGAHIVVESESGEAEGPVDCVVAGIDRAFTYEKMRLAQRFIFNGARFIATNRDATFPTERGLIPGAGSIVASIETASSVTPVTVGKPEPLMVQLLLQKYDLEAAQTAMIGDRLDTDIASAHRAGIHALYVATGVTSMEDAQRAEGEEKPDALFDDLPALCRAMLD
jgi:HAD superfamily hydrolase (TIGR01457 family)